MASWLGDKPAMAGEEVTMPREATAIPAQRQEYPGTTSEMRPRPRDHMEGYAGTGKLLGKVALITGADSGIGRAVAVIFAKEGADIVFGYLCEDDDAAETAKYIREAGRRVTAVRGDLTTEAACRHLVDRAVEEHGHIDILVNNVAYQQPVERLEDLTAEQLERTFRTNVYSYFWCTRAALPHMGDGGTIINTGSINGLRGNKTLIDYAATKGAVHAFTYSIAQTLQERGIRVNCVAPGPVWTPLIPATMPADRVEGFGKQAPFGRAADPDEIAPSFLFFASAELSSYYSGEVLAPIGGETLPG
jgi:NAD(P)-dependent dehydrogenase (short-subunit alcohol dehydrogenase family)